MNERFASRPWARITLARADAPADIHQPLRSMPSCDRKLTDSAPGGAAPSLRDAGDGTAGSVTTYPVTTSTPTPAARAVPLHNHRWDFVGLTSP